MINVLHYVINATRYAKEALALDAQIKKMPNVKYSSLFSPMENLTEVLQIKLETMLEDQDILLTHPGVWGQSVIFNDITKKFPRLEIAFLTGDTEEYSETKGKFHLFGYKNPDTIIGFINSVEASRNN